jgi:hypothetical protein
MPTTDDYHQRAMSCLELAQRAKETWAKSLLLNMAQAWKKLASEAKGELPASESKH